MIPAVPARTPLLTLSRNQDGCGGQKRTPEEAQRQAFLHQLDDEDVDMASCPPTAEVEGDLATGESGSLRRRLGDASGAIGEMFDRVRCILVLIAQQIRDSGDTYHGEDARIPDPPPPVPPKNRTLGSDCAPLGVLTPRASLGIDVSPSLKPSAGLGKLSVAPGEREGRPALVADNHPPAGFRFPQPTSLFKSPALKFFDVEAPVARRGKGAGDDSGDDDDDDDGEDDDSFVCADDEVEYLPGGCPSDLEDSDVGDPGAGGSCASPEQDCCGESSDGEGASDGWDGGPGPGAPHSGANGVAAPSTRRRYRLCGPEAASAPSHRGK